MNIRNRFIFNFASSYTGGGFKRLDAYARWFNGHGGAWFIIHPRCNDLECEFPNNRYFVVSQRKYQRIMNDCQYLDGVAQETGVPDLYYSYGIPIYARVGRVNWFHLSNMLPLAARGIPLSLRDRLTAGYLGWRIKQTYHNADIISAESAHSLSLVDRAQAAKLFLSVNGANDEIDHVRSGRIQAKDNIAVVLGTYTYKALGDSYRIFEMLRAENRQLRLVIIGEKATIPSKVRSDRSVVTTGMLPRADVLALLRSCRYYITTSRAENSYNAASEGIFFAEESFISDIGPHRELLRGMPFDEVAVPEMRTTVLHVKRQSLSTANLKSWEDVIVDMISHTHGSELLSNSV